MYLHTKCLFYRQAFIAVEKGYLESIGDSLAERASLQFDIPDGLNSYETYQKFPDLVSHAKLIYNIILVFLQTWIILYLLQFILLQVDKLNALNCELSTGTSAVVALVYRGRLYVANVGDSRALLCKTDNNQVLRVVQLSVDHDLRNEDELLRLSQLGLDVESIRQGMFVSLHRSYLAKRRFR